MKSPTKTGQVNSIINADFQTESNNDEAKSSQG